MYISLIGNIFAAIMKSDFFKIFLPPLSVQAIAVCRILPSNAEKKR